MILFGLILCISTIVGYLMLNPIYTYISNIYDFILFNFMHINYCWLFNANEPELILFQTVKWFSLFLSNTNNSIYY